jgi:hypothetical protein
MNIDSTVVCLRVQVVSWTRTPWLAFHNPCNKAEAKIAPECLVGLVEHWHSKARLQRRFAGTHRHLMPFERFRPT